MMCGKESNAFRAFLKSEGAWDEYLYNYREDISTSRTKTLESAFTWCQTESGFDYWSKLNNLWAGMTYEDKMGLLRPGGHIDPLTGYRTVTI